MNTVAIDIGGTKTLFAYLKEGVIVAREMWPSDFATWSELVDRLMPFVAQRPFDGLAVASAGMVSSRKVSPLNRSVLTFIEDIDVVADLNERFGKPCLLLNDATAAAFAEYSASLERGEISDGNNLLYITVSTGIGCGLVLGGKPLISPHGLACHAGHMAGLPISGVPPQSCSCGRPNCIESLASGAALGRFASQMLGRTVTAKSLFDGEVEKGIAKPLVEQSARQVAHLIDALHMTLDLDRVVIGGSVGQCNVFFNALSQYQIARPTVRTPVLGRARYQLDSGVVGAAMYLAQRLGNRSDA